MWVVSIRSIFLALSIGMFLVFFAIDGINCAESNPHRSFDRSTASAVYTFIAVSQLLCLQKRSIFFMVVIMLTNLLFSSSLFVVLIPTVHPRYVAFAVCF